MPVLKTYPSLYDIHKSINIFIPGTNNNIPKNVDISATSNMVNKLITGYKAVFSLLEAFLKILLPPIMISNDHPNVNNHIINIIVNTFDVVVSDILHTS